jgi:hypothetical protein
LFDHDETRIDELPRDRIGELQRHSSACEADVEAVSAHRAGDVTNYVIPLDVEIYVVDNEVENNVGEGDS